MHLTVCCSGWNNEPLALEDLTGLQVYYVCSIFMYVRARERLHKFMLKVYVICSVKCHSLSNTTSSVCCLYIYLFSLLKNLPGRQNIFLRSVWGRAAQGCMAPVVDAK